MLLKNKQTKTKNPKPSWILEVLFRIVEEKILDLYFQIKLWIDYH